MTIHFSIRFETCFGQNLYISGSLPELGGGDVSNAVPMNFNESFIWTKDIRIENIEERVLQYRYLLKSDDGASLCEVGKGRIIGLNGISKEIFLNDEWQGNSKTSPFLSSPFTEIFYKHEKSEITQLHKYSKELIIRVTALTVEKDCDIVICGNSKYIGNWDPLAAPAMTPVYGSKWEIHLPADKIEHDIEYKFIKRRRPDNEIIWENSENRRLAVPKLSPHQTWSVEHSYSALPVASPKFFGTAIPVFSLRSKNSCGIGEFSDLKPFADWAASTGQSVIQILPVNDTTSTGTWTDSYPYGGITVMGLHPIYINIPEIGPVKLKKEAARYEKERKRLNDLPQVDYEAVLKLKLEFLKIQFKTYSQGTFSEPEFLSFYEKNKEWLLPYCAFCTLRDRYGTAEFAGWGEDSKCTHALIKKINAKGSESYETMSFYMFVQFHLHRQLKSAVGYLHSKHIALKGDIPIGITPNSADAWADPELFNMDSQAGAPPDDFSADGQNWGFPTYNWDLMASRGYRWWKNRFLKMSEYFDLYRIDHVLGFFRIWEIPSTQVTGLMGHFSPALPFTPEEMRSFGFRFDYYRDATPYIRYYFLREMFGGRTDEVIEKFLDSSEFEVFTLKKEFDTQKKIETYFNDKNDDDLRDALMALTGEVLFIEDGRQRGKFHPRISAQYTYSYKALSDEEKRDYDALYNNFFYERHNEFWKASAYKKLPEIISSTDMLTCAEDLGMIPSCVPEVIRSLNILSLEIQRMPKDPAQKFGNPAKYPYLSVCTTGTHDTPTLRMWWEEDRESTRYYYHNVLHGKGEVPCQCEPAICEKIVDAHIHGASMLVILPLQDWLSIDGEIRAADPAGERINVPANPKHYWRYRMHISIEDLCAAKEFNDKLTKLLNKK